MLKLKSISYQSNDRKILDDISFEIQKGDLISIVGESGSGKSTLLKVISDLLELSSGHIEFEGKNYNDYNPIELRKKISYCVQTPVLFGNTVLDNIKFVYDIRKEEINLNAVIELFERFSLNKDYLNYDINKLSGGEKQRIALIRNLIFKPEILLLDEVTSALDSVNTKIVENYIKELNKDGVTILWVTHSDKQSTGIFNKKITIDKGNLKSIENLNQEVYS